MNIPATIPITITAEAEAHIGVLGMQAEFERMLEYVLQHFPALRRLRVVLEPPYDTGAEDTIVMDAYQDPAQFLVKDPAEREWSRWRIKTFAPDVWRHFTLLVHEDVGDAG